MKQFEISEDRKPDNRLQFSFPKTLKVTTLHMAMVYGLYLLFTAVKLKTLIFTVIIMQCGVIGTTAGYHRLWAHRAYKAKLPLRILLAIFGHIASQGSIYKWCRDHRVHHKYTETDADPHNIMRGFFFAHVGWLMYEKHPEVVEKGKTLDMKDLMEDPVVRFDRKFYFPLAVTFNFILPTLIPVWFWGETVRTAAFISVLRYGLSLNGTWLVNSAAHMYGDRPFDTRAEARENPFVSFIGSGEGWHNYHHAFPWDYAASELGYHFNHTKRFIDFMASIGQAYDLKSPTPEMVKSYMMKRGDGTRMEGREAIQEDEVDSKQNN